MMTKLREMTFIFIWILVFAFVGLMVFEWGMDITGLKGRSNIVGEIDGNKITIQDFQKALQNAYLQEKQRTGNEPDEERMSQLRDQVWEMFVQRILYAKEIEKRDIQITDREIFLHVTQNPPAEIRQNPDFQTDGRFDMNKYQQALQNPNADLRPLENYYREILPYQKLQDIVTAAVMVTEEEIRSEYINQNIKAKIEYLHIPAAAFIRDSVQATDQEIRDYYEKNKEEFTVEEKRKLNYVLFPTTPTAQDSAKIFQLAEELKKEAEAGEDFARLADEYSEDPSVQKNHGDLGYFDRNQMVKEFSEAAFSAKPGEVVGPVKTNFGIHIIKVHDRKVEEGVEKVHASHILLKFTPSALTIESAQDAANNFAELAKEEEFTVAADKLKLEVKQTPEFPKRNYIPGFGSMPAAINWTFKADVGDVSAVFRSKDGYLVFQLTDILPAGYRPFDEVKGICKSRIEQNKRLELARNFAQKVKAQLEQNMSFEEIVRADTTFTVRLDSTKEFSMSQPIPKIGKAPEVTAVAFTLEPGKISDMVETRRGIYFIRVVERTPFNEVDYKRQREAIRARLLNTKRQKFFAEWYEKLKEKMDIEDNRNLFFSS
ncbi:MAG: peptidylprolyl isomerase [Calditrichia bacterium]